MARQVIEAVYTYGETSKRWRVGQRVRNLRPFLRGEPLIGADEALQTHGVQVVFGIKEEKRPASHGTESAKRPVRHGRNPSIRAGTHGAERALMTSMLDYDRGEKLSDGHLAIDRLLIGSGEPKSWRWQGTGGIRGDAPCNDNTTSGECLSGHSHMCLKDNGNAVEGGSIAVAFHGQFLDIEHGVWAREASTDWVRALKRFPHSADGTQMNEGNSTQITPVEARCPLDTSPSQETPHRAMPAIQQPTTVTGHCERVYWG